MATPTQTAKTASRTFTTQQLRTLRDLRARYRQDRDLLTPREVARLHFIRWLVQAGRLIP